MHGVGGGANHLTLCMEIKSSHTASWLYTLLIKYEWKKKGKNRGY